MKRKKLGELLLERSLVGKEQLASDYERWGKMVATIEAIMTAK